MTEALGFDDVTFTYPDGDRPALDEVEVSLAEGSFGLVVGPTGSGKSTLLRAANGLVPQFTGGTFHGRVSVGGRDTLAHPPRRLADVVAFVPQDPGATFVLDRVEDELAYGMENLGVDPSHMRRRVEETLDLLDVETLRGRSVRTLSGGERQRVAIAAALAAGPSILLLDEPTSQLDPQGAEDVLAALQRLVHDHGMTVLLAEHRLERVAGWVDDAIGVDGGRVAQGPPADVLRMLGTGPPVARIGAIAGWDPAPLTVRDARRFAATLRLPAPSPPARNGRGPVLASVRGLVATYGASEALRGLDLDLHEGEVVAVMGRNGAGKSTLLRVLAGVHEPSRGRVLVRGEPPRPGADAALCPQEADDLLFHETVEREVRAPPPGPLRRPAPPRRRRVRRGDRRPAPPPRRAHPGARSTVEGSAHRVPPRVGRRRERGRPRDARRGAGRGGRHPCRDARRRRSDRRRSPGDRPGRFPGLRAADDARVRPGVAHDRAGRGGAAVNVAVPGAETAARERLTVRVPGVRVALLLAANAIGVLAFVWPFVLPSVAGSFAANHQGDGPWILAALGAILLALLFLELGRGGLGPKTVALLGVLGAAMVALRVPGFVAGFSALFIVVLVAGNSLGPGFGFLLGCVGMFASGLFIGGLGPWLPFEMVAVGWVGGGAGLLPHGRSWTTRIAVLAAYGVLSGYLYGLVMELWFWPFVTGGSALAWDPTAGAVVNLRHYLSFYLVDGFAWDTFRAVGNALLVIAIGRPVLGALDRAARRMQLHVV